MLGNLFTVYLVKLNNILILCFIGFLVTLGETFLHPDRRLERLLYIFSPVISRDLILQLEEQYTYEASYIQHAIRHFL